MFVSELMAMAIVTTLMALCFLASLGSVVWLTGRLVKAVSDYLHESLELRRFESQAGLERARLQGSIPVWVDKSDPTEVAAWNRAVAETWRITATHALTRHPES